MEKRIIKVDKRILNTKHSVKEIRKQGLVPGILYGRKTGSIPITVAEKDLRKIGGAHLIEITLPGGTYPALLREVQKHPVSGEVRHVDFQQVELDKKIRAEIPVHVSGEPAGVRMGGVLQLGERTVEVEAFPDELPDYLEADVSGLRIGEKLSVGDLQKTTSLRITTDLDSIVAVVVSPRIEEGDEAEESEEAVEEKREDRYNGEGPS